MNKRFSGEKVTAIGGDRLVPFAASLVDTSIVNDLSTEVAVGEEHVVGAVCVTNHVIAVRLRVAMTTMSVVTHRDR